MIDDALRYKKHKEENQKQGCYHKWFTVLKDHYPELTRTTKTAAAARVKLEAQQTKRARSDHPAVNPPKTESPLLLIKEAKEMLDNGVLTQPEFGKIKAIQIAKMG